MFSVQDRERMRDRVLKLASSDTRIVTGAVVGSLSRDNGDRSDLTFAVANGVPVLDVAIGGNCTVGDGRDDCLCDDHHRRLGEDPRDRQGWHR